MTEDEIVNLDNFLDDQSADINIISKNSSGFGIGLTISNLIALYLSNLKRKNNGGVQFKSKSDIGSEFSVIILNF